MKAWNDKLAPLVRRAPVLWLTAMLAALMAVLLLSAFVDTLHEHMRRGSELRLAQGREAPAFAQMADATAGHTAGTATAATPQAVRLR